MKLKDLEKIKLLETALIIGIPIGAIIISPDISKDELTNIVNLAAIPKMVDILLTSRVEIKTIDYKKMEELYNKIVLNFTNFLKENNITEPIEVFVVYQYMYRNGFLSFNQNFNYDTNMKDFYKLTGADVVRGKGVCRSISSFLTDIYRNLGYDASNLLVNVNRKTLNNIERLGNYEKFKINKKTNNFVKIVSGFTKILKMPNHLITSVEKDGKVYIFDPINDGFLKKGKYNNLILASDVNYKMKLSYITNSLQNILKQINNVKSPHTLNKHLSLETINYDEYKKIYLNTLNFVKENTNIFSKFCIENYELYEDLFNEMEKNSSMLERLFPELKIFNFEKIDINKKNSLNRK